MSKDKQVQLPAGFEKVSDGKLADEWDYEKEPELQGRVVRKKIVDCIQQGKPAKAPMMLIDRGDKELCVWESASLRDLFESADSGDEVYIKYLGITEMDEGRNDMKTFYTAIKPKAEGGE